MTHDLYCGNCLDILRDMPPVRCVFADPPDNIGLAYRSYRDRAPERQYLDQFRKWLELFIDKAGVTWISFNARWTFEVGRIVSDLVDHRGIEAKPCVQTFTFGQHRKTDLGNNHRPLWRLRWPDAKLHPDHIRVSSWRQRNGDRRAAVSGRVPGDVFEFPRVTGNSKQRRPWHPTQLHEGLVERCIKLSTCEGDTVCDPFAGTGTTLRVCQRIGRRCITMDVDRSYCQRIAAEYSIPVKTWEITSVAEANDFTGRPIKAGDTICYPVRRGSSMRLKKLLVAAVQDTFRGVCVSGLNETGRRINIYNTDNCIVVESK